jgi:hypothetical protein
MRADVGASTGVPFDLPPVTRALGELIGLVNADGSVDVDWFGNPVSELEDLPTRLGVLVDLLPDLLGDPSAPAPPSGTSWSWYAVPNAETGTGTPLNVVATEDGAGAGLGLGVLARTPVGGGSVEVLVELPLFEWQAGQRASFAAGPAQIGLTVTPPSGASYPVVSLVVSLPLTADPQPSFTLTVGNSTYMSLAEVEAGAVAELNAVISGLATWLATQAGQGGATVAAILEGGGVIAAQGGGYVLTLDSLRTKGPLGFVTGALGALASSATPVVPFAGGGLYVAHDAGAWGVRLQTATSLSLDVAGEKVSLALGTFVAGDSATDNWLSRSLGTAAPEPGVTVHFLDDGGGFAPSVRLVEVGLDVTGAGGKPLFDQRGFTLKAFESRGYFDSVDRSHGFGLALDGVGFPVVPSTATGAASNPVAHDLVHSGGEGGGDGGDQEPANPAFSASVGRGWHAPGPGAVTVRLSDPEGKPESVVWVPIQRAFGPLQLGRIGVEWDDPNPDHRLGILLDAGVKLGSLEVDLLSLELKIPLTAPRDLSKYGLELDGMALSYESSDLTIAAAFEKNTATTPIEYDGTALIKTGKWALAAIGSYASMDGSPSMFIFAQLEAELGGPPFFFVTGLCAGFGYNRSLKAPSVDQVDKFPLLAGIADPSKIGGQGASPKQALDAIGEDWIKPQRGANWVAAGVQFTSFKLVESNVVAIVTFGDQFRVLILGVSRMKLGQTGPQFAYVELDLEVLIDPAQGLISAEAVLTPASYALDPDCHLTGGFAFYVWFKGQHAGDFVVTIGGYHPAFKKPDHYPDVPRLGFSWFPTSDITIQGDAYFALTPSCAMGGGGLDLEFASGDLRAWFTAQADFLFHWKPFYFEGDVGISIGASYKLDLLFTSVTVSVELGASLSIHGPPTGGSVHIDWYIISFTVPFGPDPGGPKDFQPWSEFAPLLPEPDKPHAALRAGLDAVSGDDAVTAQPLKAAITDGLMKLAPDGTTWLVRADALAIDVDTAFPAGQVVLDGPAPTKEPATAEAICVRPMGAAAATSVLTVCVETAAHEKQDLGEAWSSALKRGAVPAALWGEPVDPAAAPPPSADVLKGKITGLTGLTPRQAQPVGPPPMPVTNLAHATIDENDWDWLPLSATDPTVSRQPQPDGLEAVADTLVATAAERTNVRGALIGLAADPGQDGDVSAVVAKLAEDFADEPMLGAPWTVAG